MNQPEVSAGGARPSWRPGVFLGLLIAALVVLESLPILNALRHDALWFLNSPEDFTWSFWPPLKPALRPSYFFFQTGPLYWTLIRPLHWVTATILHTTQATVAYMQLFGYLVKTSFSALTVVLAAFVVSTRRISWVGKATVLLFMLYMIAGTVPLFQIYEFHVGLHLGYKLVQAAACVMLVIQLERIFNNGRPCGQFPVLTGILGGLLLFDMPLYSYLTLLLAGNILSAMPLRAWPITLVTIVASGAAAAAALLSVFYFGDFASIDAAIHSQLSGILRGFPQPQPGFREYFVDRALRLDSWYFVPQVCFLGGLLLAIALIIWHIRRPAQERRPRFDSALLRLSLLYLFCLLVHLITMLQHGSYTIVFSAFFLTVLYMLLILLTLAHRGGVRKHRTLALTAAGTAGLLLIVGPAYNLDLFGVNPFGSFQTNTLPGTMGRAIFPSAAESGAARAYERFLEEVDPEHLLTLEVNQSLYSSGCLVPWQYTFAEGWLHMGSGIGGFVIDRRYRGMFQRERYPMWHLHFPAAIRAVGYHAGTFRVTETENPVTRVEHTWIVPLTPQVGTSLVRSRERQVTWIEFSKAYGQARKALVDGYPKTALYETNTPWAPDTRAWSVVPLAPEEATEEALLSEAPPVAVALKSDYLPFLGSLCGTYHLVLIKAGPGSTTQALATMLTARWEAQQRMYWAQARRLARAVRAYHAANGCYPAWTGADVMPRGLAPYVSGPWPAGYHYLALDSHYQGAGRQSTAYHIGVAANLVEQPSELAKTVWVVHDQPASVC